MRGSLFLAVPALITVFVCQSALALNLGRPATKDDPGIMATGTVFIQGPDGRVGQCQIWRVNATQAGTNSHCVPKAGSRILYAKFGAGIPGHPPIVVSGGSFFNRDEKRDLAVINFTNLPAGIPVMPIDDSPPRQEQCTLLHRQCAAETGTPGTEGCSQPAKINSGQCAGNRQMIAAQGSDGINYSVVSQTNIGACQGSSGSAMLGANKAMRCLLNSGSGVCGQANCVPAQDVAEALRGMGVSYTKPDGRPVMQSKSPMLASAPMTAPMTAAAHIPGVSDCAPGSRQGGVAKKNLGEIGRAIDAAGQTEKDQPGEPKKSEPTQVAAAQPEPTKKDEKAKTPATGGSRPSAPELPGSDKDDLEGLRKFVGEVVHST